MVHARHLGDDAVVVRHVNVAVEIRHGAELCCGLLDARQQRGQHAGQLQVRSADLGVLRQPQRGRTDPLDPGRVLQSDEKSTCYAHTHRVMPTHKTKSGGRGPTHKQKNTRWRLHTKQKNGG